MQRAIITAVILFVVDAFFLGQGIIALCTLFLVLPVMLIRALLARKDKSLLKKRLAVFCTFLVMASLIIVTIRANNTIASRRAEKIIEACEEYRDKNSSYPENLSDLVPEFLGRIPVAKYTFSSNRFIYISQEDTHTLMYVSRPPFGRPIYNFEKKEWGYLD